MDAFALRACRVLDLVGVSYIFTSPSLDPGFPRVGGRRCFRRYPRSSPNPIRRGEEGARSSARARADIVPRLARTYVATEGAERFRQHSANARMATVGAQSSRRCLRPRAVIIRLRGYGSY